MAAILRTAVNRKPTPGAWCGDRADPHTVLGALRAGSTPSVTRIRPPTPTPGKRPGRRAPRRQGSSAASQQDHFVADARWTHFWLSGRRELSRASSCGAPWLVPAGDAVRCPKVCREVWSATDTHAPRLRSLTVPHTPEHTVPHPLTRRFRPGDRQPAPGRRSGVTARTARVLRNIGEPHTPDALRDTVPGFADGGR